jgi:ATP:cob(I)alamin adenosyltransferase
MEKNTYLNNSIDYCKATLRSGESVDKNHPAIKCACEINLLESSIGKSFKYLDDYKELTKSLVKIQSNLTNIKDEIATHPRGWCDSNKGIKYINQKDVDYVQKCCEQLGDVYEIKEFVRYGVGGEASSHFDYVSNLCDTCEVMIYDLDDNITNADVSIYIKKYINNLSKYLYLIARIF